MPNAQQWGHNGVRSFFLLFHESPASLDFPVLTHTGLAQSG